MAKSHRPKRITTHPGNVFVQCANLPHRESSLSLKEANRIVGGQTTSGIHDKWGYGQQGKGGGGGGGGGGRSRSGPVTMLWRVIKSGLVPRQPEPAPVNNPGEFQPAVQDNTRVSNNDNQEQNNDNQEQNNDNQEQNSNQKSGG